MSRKKAVGVSAHAAVVAWVYLRGGTHHPEGYTIRWRCGDGVASVLAGKQLSSHVLTDVLTTVEVPPRGWVDEAQVRAQGQRWWATHTKEKGAGR